MTRATPKADGITYGMCETHINDAIRSVQDKKGNVITQKGRHQDHLGDAT